MLETIHGLGYEVSTVYSDNCNEYINENASLVFSLDIFFAPALIDILRASPYLENKSYIVTKAGVCFGSTNNKL